MLLVAAANTVFGASNGHTTLRKVRSGAGTYGLGPLLKSSRQQLGLSRGALASKADVSMRLVAEFERGQRSNVSLESALRLFKTVGSRSSRGRRTGSPPRSGGRRQRAWSAPRVRCTVARRGRGATSTSETPAMLRWRRDHCLGGSRQSPRSPRRPTRSHPADADVPKFRGRSGPADERACRWRTQRRAVGGLRRLPHVDRRDRRDRRVMAEMERKAVAA